MSRFADEEQELRISEDLSSGCLAMHGICGHPG
jgi:hypothetical protein